MPDTLPVMETKGVAVVVPDTVEERLAGTVAENVGKAEAVFAEEALADALTEPVAGSEGAPVLEPETEPLGVPNAPSERVGSADMDSDKEPDWLAQDVGEGVVKPLEVPQSVTTAVRDAVEDTVAEADIVRERGAVADAVEVTDSRGEAVPLGIVEGVTVADADCENTPVTVPEGDTENSGVPVAAGETVAAALSVDVVLAVPVPDTDDVDERVFSAVPEPTPEVVPVGSGERDAEAESVARAVVETDAVKEPERLTLGELLAEALPEGCAEFVRVPTTERDAVLETDTVTVGVSPSEEVGALEADGGVEGDTTGVADAGGVRESLLAGVCVAEADSHAEAEPGCRDFVPLSVIVGELVPEAGSGEEDTVPEGSSEGVPDEQRVGPAAHAVGETVPVTGAEGEPEPLAEPVAEATRGVAVLGPADGDVEKEVVALPVRVPP